MIEHAKTSFETEFTQYSQSEPARTKRDSSVSYAAAVVRPTVADKTAGTDDV